MSQALGLPGCAFVFTNDGFTTAITGLAQNDPKAATTIPAATRVATKVLIYLAFSWPPYTHSLHSMLFQT